MDNKSHSTLMSLALAGIIIAAWSEVSALWTVTQNWSKLFSLTGSIAITLYLILLLLGLFYLIAGSWRAGTLNQWAGRLQISSALRWLIIGGLLLILTYIYLYSNWQVVLSQPWIQLIFAMGLAQIILWVAAPQREQYFGWGELALALNLFLYPRIVQEIRALFVEATVYRVATVAGFVILLFLVFALYSTYGERLRASLISWREKLRDWRFGMIALLCLTSILHRYLVDPQTYIIYDDIRFAVLLAAVWMVAYLGVTGLARLVSPEALGLSLGVLLFISFLARYSLLITDYPFSLSWSEGNRFYDYSLVFGQSLYNYNGHISNPYSSPGRYGLWGVVFLWQGLPIWFHRFWNLILQTVPVIIFSILITRKLTPSFLRHGVSIWITLFLTVLAPLHPPFVIVSIIAVLFAFDESLIKRGISLGVAGLYAGLSRWTWVFAPAALGVLIDLMLYYPKRSGALWRRLLPAAILAAISLIAGLLPSMGAYFSLARGESLSSGQLLLWYRLLPNDTLGLGVLFLALMYTLPLVILLAWWMISPRWQLDWAQKIAIWGALIGFFAIGLVISTKIGGGGDLHNLDMYLITLLVVTVIGLMSQNNNIEQTRWPAWAMGLILCLIAVMVYPFTPFYSGSSYHSRLDLPKDNDIAEALSITQSEVARYSEVGEVLFMDQRQLLTFHYISPLPFVPEYEKKFMMDQAMGNNDSYFQAYYDDLARKRFALIVTEPLKIKRREELGGPFSEENDAWVLWVSNPTLCFYEPIYSSTAVNIELLVPKQNPLGCEEYLK